MTDKEAIRIVTELYEEERKEERKMEEKELKETAKAINEEIAALEEHIAEVAEESKRITDEMDKLMDAYGLNGEIPRSVMAQAIMINSIDYYCRRLANKVVKAKDEN